MTPLPAHRKWYSPCTWHHHNVPTRGGWWFWRATSTILEPASRFQFSTAPCACRVAQCFMLAETSFRLCILLVPTSPPHLRLVPRPSTAFSVSFSVSIIFVFRRFGLLLVTSFSLFVVLSFFFLNSSLFFSYFSFLTLASYLYCSSLLLGCASWSSLKQRIEDGVVTIPVFSINLFSLKCHHPHSAIKEPFFLLFS